MPKTPAEGNKSNRAITRNPRRVSSSKSFLPGQTVRSESPLGKTPAKDIFFEKMPFLHKGRFIWCVAWRRLMMNYPIKAIDRSVDAEPGVNLAGRITHRSSLHSRLGGRFMGGSKR